MSIFDVEVDPKAIEAAANEKPPPYIPNDKDDDDDEPDKKQTTKALSANGESNGEYLVEVVEEDAEEEKRQTQQSAAATHTGGPQFNNSSALWSTFEDENEQDVEFPEPTVDDFFPTPMDEDNMMGGAGESEATVVKQDPPSTSVKGQVVQETPALSLVPKKSSTTKTKRPKFRTKSRKKK